VSHVLVGTTANGHLQSESASSVRRQEGRLHLHAKQAAFVLDESKPSSRARAPLLPSVSRSGQALDSSDLSFRKITLRSGWQG
jgi:hypothetical protein